ncbi:MULTISPECIES: tetracycline resistance determinant leader peptide [Enterobacterales]|uniref:Uncharacterized protein n=3 Tax=Enterobacteriaceae TaxID=543 RepID=A0A2S1PN44_ECOLX|nr:hypothetical protein [Escherichia coli]AZM67701.1 hypothetical protein [Salmonella enterica subsp. enterica serovar Agona]UDP43368.1 Tracycline resistance determinant leader peptide [Salmonella enterica subsp. enterica serovar 1,4,[5],12:i:-]SQR14995.1 tetracycline resistance determinant leader peptide [Escherichia coli]SQR61583.1 tetracycline resistance determinant leader peptide [Escherichia coli]
MLRSRVTVFGILNLTEDSFFKDDLRSLYLKEIFTPFCRIRLKFTGRSYLNICMLCMPMVMHKNPSDKSIYHWDFYALLGF